MKRTKENTVNNLLYLSDFSLRKVKIRDWIVDHWDWSNIRIQRKFDICRNTVKKYRKEIENNQFNIFHGNTGKENSQKTLWLDENMIIDQYKKANHLVWETNKEFKLPIKHFYNQHLDKSWLANKNISYKTIVDILHTNFPNIKGIKKSTRRKLKEKKKRQLYLNQITKEEYDNLVKCLDKINSDKNFITKEKYEYGERVEIDGCKEFWFGGSDIKWNLNVAVDHSSGKLLSIWASKEEDNQSYQNLLFDLFKDHGIPLEIRTDRRTSFYNKTTIKTEFAKSIENLGLIMKLCSSPTFKPKVERTNRTLQDFLPSYLVLNKIDTISKFNKARKEIIKEYNQTYDKKKSKYSKNLFQQVDENEIERALIIPIDRCKNANAVLYNKEIYTVNNKNGLRMNLPKNSIFGINRDNELKFVIGKEIYDANKIDEIYLSKFELFCFRKQLSFDNVEAYRVYKLRQETLAFYKKYKDRLEQLNEKEEYLRKWENKLKKIN